MKKAVLLTVCVFISALSFSQNAVLPFKVTIYQDAAQVLQKGILRFKEKQADVELNIDPIPGSIDFKGSGDFRIAWFKIREDSVLKRVPAGSWSDVIKGNPRKKFTIVYQIGQDFDELTGEVMMVNEKDEMIMLRESGGSDFFIPMDQIRQVMVEPIGNYNLEKKVPQKVVSIGISEDVPFVPIEMNALVEGMSWEPECRIRVAESQEAFMVVNAVLENKAGDFEDVFVELSESKVREGGRIETEVLDLGRHTLKNGEHLVVKVRETQIGYSETYQCSSPWEGVLLKEKAGKVPVNYSVTFKIPRSAPLMCANHSVFDAKNRHLANLDLTEPDKDGNIIIPVGEERDVVVNFAEAAGKREGKPQKKDDQQFINTHITGRATVINYKTVPVSLTIEREINGEVMENNRGVVLRQPGKKTYKIIWVISVNPGETREIPYNYDTLLPFQKSDKVEKEEKSKKSRKKKSKKEPKPEKVKPSKEDKKADKDKKKEEKNEKPQ